MRPVCFLLQPRTEWQSAAQLDQREPCFQIKRRFCNCRRFLYGLLLELSKRHDLRNVSAYYTAVRVDTCWLCSSGRSDCTDISLRAPWATSSDEHFTRQVSLAAGVQHELVPATFSKGLTKTVLCVSISPYHTTENVPLPFLSSSKSKRVQLIAVGHTSTYCCACL